MAAVGAARSGRMTAVPRRAEEVVAAAVGMTAQGKAANRLYGLQFLNFIAVMIFFRIRFFPDPNCDCCNHNPRTGSRAWGTKILQNYIIKAK